MSLFSYINQMLELPIHTKQNGRISKTLAASHLLTTNEKCHILNENKAQLFHHRVANLLYICWYTRQDIQMAVAFPSRDPTRMIIETH